MPARTSPPTPGSMSPPTNPARRRGGRTRRHQRQGPRPEPHAAKPLQWPFGHGSQRRHPQRRLHPHRKTLPQRGQTQEIQKLLGYLWENADLMRYADFRLAGHFVGSGVVEAGCRTVVGQPSNIRACSGVCAGPMPSSPCAVVISPTALRTSGLPPLKSPLFCHAPGHDRPHSNGLPAGIISIDRVREA
jgi:hypothetical protein